MQHSCSRFLSYYLAPAVTDDFRLCVYTDGDAEEMHIDQIKSYVEGAQKARQQVPPGTFDKKYSLRVGDTIRYRDRMHLVPGRKDAIVEGRVVHIEFGGRFRGEWQVTTSPPHCGLDSFWNPTFRIVSSRYSRLDAPPAGMPVDMNDVNLIPGESRGDAAVQDNSTIDAIPGGNELMAVSLAISSAKKRASGVPLDSESSGESDSSGEGDDASESSCSECASLPTAGGSDIVGSCVTRRKAKQMGVKIPDLGEKVNKKKRG